LFHLLTRPKELNISYKKTKRSSNPVKGPGHNAAPAALPDKRKNRVLFLAACAATGAATSGPAAGARAIYIL